jgi:phosphate starvation-inducible PhoH-like protein
VEVPLPGLPPNKFPPDSVYVTVTGAAIRPQTPSQQAYVKAIRDNDMVFGVGPAGTGKTYLAVACAIAALESGRVNRIVLTRPVVEAGEKLGFLPGDFYEKVHPYLKPLYDAFHNMVGADRFRQLREDETIEIIPLAYMRGRTLDEAFAILDEAQNTTPEQMKMFLTRMGNGSRMVITGDVTQIDLDKKLTSGLVQIQDVLRGVEGIDFVRFSEVDVVRHPLVKKIIRAFDAWDERGRTPPPGSPPPAV